MKQVLVAVAGRSEMVRLAPLIRSLRDEFTHSVSTRWMHTGVSPDRVWQTGSLFGLAPDREFELQHRPENLVEHSWELANLLGKEIDFSRPDLLVVQGESLSSMLASQQAFMRRIPVVTLPTASRYLSATLEPRQQSHRRLISAVAGFHCLADQKSVADFRSEGVPALEMGVTGDTVVDALSLVTRHGMLQQENPSLGRAVSLQSARIFVALHSSARRVGATTELALSIAALEHHHPGLSFTIVMEPESPIRGLLHSVLESIANVTIHEPMPYHEFLCLMQTHDLVLTDSIDLHGEAATLQKPVLVMGDMRSESDADDIPGLQYVSWDQEHLCAEVRSLLADDATYRTFVPVPNPLGDGQAAKRIARLILNWSRNEVLTPRAFEPFRWVPRLRGISANLHAV